MPEVSNTFTVHCDICGESMRKREEFWACYPCYNVIWESELWRYDSCVEVHRDESRSDLS